MTGEECWKMKQTTDFVKMKAQEEKIAMVTAYDYPSAKLAEEAGVDMILVGDSLGMVVLGYDSTIPVTVADMVHHTKAVKRGAKNTFIVTDMPFMSYHLSREETLKNGARIIQDGGAHAVKLEGGKEVAAQIEALTESGIPVMAHIGLTPQRSGFSAAIKSKGKQRKPPKSCWKMRKRARRPALLLSSWNASRGSFRKK